MLMEIQKKGNFKARPFNKKVFESSGKLGIPKVEKMVATEFQAFNLHSNSIRSKSKDVKTTEERELMECKAFKALELNKKILEQPST